MRAYLRVNILRYVNSRVRNEAEAVLELKSTRILDAYEENGPHSGEYFPLTSDRVLKSSKRTKERSSGVSGAFPDDSPSGKGTITPLASPFGGHTPQLRSLGPATLDFDAMHAGPQFEETNVEGDVTSSDLAYNTTLLICALMTL